MKRIAAEDTKTIATGDFPGAEAAAVHRFVAVCDAVLTPRIGKAGAVGAAAALPAPILVTLAQPRRTDALATLTDMTPQAGCVTRVRNALAALACLAAGTGGALATTAIGVSTALTSAIRHAGWRR